MSGRIALQVSGLIRLAVVARFVPPNQFGLMAIVLIVLQVLEAFTTPGFNQALIQRQGTIDSLLPSVFTVNILRGLTLGTFILLAGPFVASFFDQSDSANIIQSAAIIVVVRSIQSPSIVSVHRELRYKAHFFWDLTSTSAALMTALLLLFYTQSVWVLLIALIVEEIVRTSGSYVIAPWRPRLQLIWRDILELNRFGRWVVLGTSVAFISLQLDNIVIGRLMDAEALGIYQVAMKISQLPATQISQVVATVAFPTLSRLRGQDERFCRAYLQMFTGLFIVNFFISGVMILFAGPIITIGLGDQWEQAIPSLRILAAAGFIRSLVTVGGKVFYAAGRPKYDSAMNIIRTVVFALLIVPMVRAFGLEGASLVVFISIACVLPMYLYLIERSIGARPLDHVSLIRTVAGTSFGRIRRIIYGTG